MELLLICCIMRNLSVTEVKLVCKSGSPLLLREPAAFYCCHRFVIRPKRRQQKVSSTALKNSKLLSTPKYYCFGREFQW